MKSPTLTRSDSCLHWEDRARLKKIIAYDFVLNIISNYISVSWADDYTYLVTLLKYLSFKNN